GVARGLGPDLLPHLDAFGLRALADDRRARLDRRRRHVGGQGLAGRKRRLLAAQLLLVVARAEATGARGIRAAHHPARARLAAGAAAAPGWRAEAGGHALRCPGRDPLRQLLEIERAGEPLLEPLGDPFRERPTERLAECA